MCYIWSGFIEYVLYMIMWDGNYYIEYYTSYIYYTS